MSFFALFGCWPFFNILTHIIAFLFSHMSIMKLHYIPSHNFFMHLYIPLLVFTFFFSFAFSTFFQYCTFFPFPSHFILFHHIQFVNGDSFESTLSWRARPFIIVQILFKCLFIENTIYSSTCRFLSIEVLSFILHPLSIFNFFLFTPS